MTLSRRRFHALTSAALASGLLPHWAVRAAAQSAPTLRFLAVRTPHGADRDFWIPRPSGGGEPPTADHPLGELTFEYEDSVLGAMMPWRDKITVLDGLDTQVSKEKTRPDRRDYHGHNEQGVLLTGAQPPADREGNYDNHPSLDFVLHDRLPSPALLTASVEGTGTWKCMSYDEGGRPREPESDPRALFRQAFPADFEPPAVGMPAIDYGAGETLIANYGKASLMRLRERLRGRERVKIDQHLAAMARLQMQAGPAPGGPAGACTTSGSDVPMRDGGVGSVAAVEQVTRAHARVIAQAFACGRSRVATLQVLNDYPNYFTDLPDARTPAIIAKYGESFRFHENLVHDYWTVQGQERADLRKGYSAGLRWSAQHFAIVLEELDNMPDPLDPGGGSVLANTIVFWHNEFGHEGHDNQETRHPVVMAGGSGRVLKLGRYLRLRNIQSNERVPHNRLLVSICHALGLGDIEYFGDRDLESRANYRGPLTPLMV
jgi:Protein of unknown function (DUF1552)